MYLAEDLRRPGGCGGGGRTAVEESKVEGRRGEKEDRSQKGSRQSLVKSRESKVEGREVAGRSADEIAAQVLTTEPENAMFRAAMLVEIILHQISSSTEEENQ